MRTYSCALYLAASLMLTGCGWGDQINASSDRSLFRSVSALQRRLPEKERVEFEVSFWSLKQSADSEMAFRKSVNGKTTYEVIDMGKQNFETRKVAGDKDYTVYPSWDAMIAELVEERRKSSYRPDKRDSRNKIQGT